ncbi:MAG: hypothetical protein QXR58_01955 [Candidatus Micrarchaeaceae archaeon]
MVEAMRLNLFRKKEKTNRITAINLKFNGEIHSVEGMEAKGRIFTVTIPFTNRPYSNYLTEAEVVRASDFDPISLKSITAVEPFRVLAVEPALPRKVGPEERVEFKISVEAPDYAYSGPLTLEFVEENKEIIHIELSKVVVNAFGKSIEADSEINMMNLPKNHIFQQNLQLLKILDYGTKVESIAVDKPFEFEGSLPKLPFIVNDASSFVAAIYIKAPDTNYAGPLVLNIK